MDMHTDRKDLCKDARAMIDRPCQFRDIQRNKWIDTFVQYSRIYIICP